MEASCTDLLHRLARAGRGRELATSDSAGEAGSRRTEVRAESFNQACNSAKYRSYICEIRFDMLDTFVDANARERCGSRVKCASPAHGAGLGGAGRGFSSPDVETNCHYSAIAPYQGHARPL